MWIVKNSQPATRADVQENLARLQKSLQSDNSSPPMAKVYVQVLVAAGRETIRLLGGNLSLHTDELERAKDLPQMIHKALNRGVSSRARNRPNETGIHRGRRAVGSLPKSSSSSQRQSG